MSSGAKPGPASPDVPIAVSRPAGSGCSRSRRWLGMRFPPTGPSQGRALALDQPRRAVRRDADLLIQIRRARAQDRLDRHRDAVHGRALDRLDDADVREPLVARRLGIDAVEDAPYEVLDLGG